MTCLFASLLLHRGFDPAAQVDAVLQTAYQDHHLPSLAAAFVLDGKVVLKKTYGVKTLGRDERPDPDTVYGLGSTSKAMTAFGLMVLVDQGKVDLDAPVGNYLPKLPPAWRPIHVVNFLTHTSGLADGQLKQAKGRNVWEQFGNWAKAHPLVFKPGASQVYSNVNFAVVGQLISVLSGSSYITFMQREVWIPLGMKATGDWTSKLRGNMASPYEGPNHRAVRQGVDVVPEGIPSGGLVSTLDDMLRWEEAIRAGKLLSPDAYAAMFRPLVPPGSTARWHFCPGWQVRKAAGQTVIAKDGSVQGYMSMIQLVPERNAAIILLSNVQDKGASLWPVAAKVWQRVLGIPGPAGLRGDN